MRPAPAVLNSLLRFLPKPLMVFVTCLSPLLVGIAHSAPSAQPQVYEEWLQKAEAGDAYCQYLVGNLYYTGQRVPQDYSLAAPWFRKAADQGRRDAQYYLGLMYEKGHGVPTDLIEAHKWLNLATTHEYGGMYLRSREEVAKKMTPAQIAEAQKRATAWMVEFQKRKK